MLATKMDLACYHGLEDLLAEAKYMASFPDADELFMEDVKNLSIAVEIMRHEINPELPAPQVSAAELRKVLSNLGDLWNYSADQAKKDPSERIWQRDLASIDYFQEVAKNLRKETAAHG